MASYHLPKVVKAEDLTVREGKLTWSSHGVSSEIDVGSLLFALKPPASAHQYIICGLKENNSESAATTFELVLLQTNSIPDQISSLHLVSQIPPHLRPSTDNLVDIVVSTKAGSGLALRFWQTVLHPLLRVAREELAQASPGTEAAELAGIQQESVLVTENAGSVPQFAQRLWASHGGQAHRDGGGKQSRTVILLSGDGGVVDILNSCEEDHDAQAPAASSPPQPLVCPLPLGTGNALFHSLHKPVASARPASSPLVLGLQTLFQGAPANLPTFRASFSAGSRVVVAAAEGQQHQAAADGGGATDTPPELQEEGGNNRPVSYLNGAVVASYGFHASIVHESDTPAYRAHGQKRFGMVAQELLRRSHPYTAQVEIRRPGAAAASFERVPRETHAYVLVTPLSNLERTFAISPDSRPLDGRLRAVHFGPIGGERIMDVMMKAYDGGKHVGLAWEEDGERVWYDEVEEIRLKALDADGRWRKVCIDGTIVELPVGGDVVVSKSNHTLLRVLAPKEVLPA
jgi:diacylglycerol kinase family enzyme